MNYDSLNADHYLTSNEDDLLEGLQHSLSISVLSERMRGEEAQITSLIQALLKFSDNRVNVQQHEFAQEYTICDNADLYASVLDITREKMFKDSNSEQIDKKLLRSSVFLKMTISAQGLEDSIMKMMNFLPVGFLKDYLIRYPKEQIDLILI